MLGVEPKDIKTVRIPLTCNTLDPVVSSCKAVAWLRVYFRNACQQNTAILSVTMTVNLVLQIIYYPEL